MDDEFTPDRTRDPSPQDAATGILARLKIASGQAAVRHAPEGLESGLPALPEEDPAAEEPFHRRPPYLPKGEETGLPASSSSLRTSSRARVGIATGLLCLGIAAAAGWKFLPATGQTVVSAETPRASPAVSSPEAMPSEAETGGPQKETGTGEIVVDVSGAVQKPGLLRLPRGSRVGDALVKSGGPAPDADLRSVNRAQRLTDGQQVLIPRRGESLGPAGPNLPEAARRASDAGTSRARGGGTERVNINAATAQELQSLPRIGPIMAQRIVEEREKGGPYRSIGDLRRVKGLGPSLLRGLAEHVDF